MKNKRMIRCFSFILATITVLLCFSSCAGINTIINFSDGNDVILETENFSVTKAMMQYLVNANFLHLYSKFDQHISIFGIDPYKSLKEQPFDPTNAVVSTFLIQNDDELKGFSGTWFDYFTRCALEKVKDVLVLCEEARAQNVTLNEEDMKKADEIAKNTDLSLYGRGVKRADVKKVLELFILAEKFEVFHSENTLESLKADDSAVLNYFDNNKTKYCNADYLSFKFTESYAAPHDTSKEEYARMRYMERVYEVLDIVKALSESGTEEEFRTLLIKYWFEKNWQSQYDNTINRLKKSYPADGGIVDTDIPSEDVRNAKKAAALEQVCDALLNGKKKDEMESSGNTAYDRAIDLVKEELFTKLSDPSYYGGIEKKYMDFNDETNENKWTFDSSRKAGDIKYFTSNDVEYIQNSDGTHKWNVDISDYDYLGGITQFTVEVRFIIKPLYLIEEKTREFGHILICGSSESENTEAENSESENTENENTLNKVFFETHIITPNYSLPEYFDIYAPGQFYGKESEKETVDSTQKPTRTEAEAKAEAERIFAELSSDNITMERFAALAKGNTEDTEIFYDDVILGQMIEEINDWLFADERKPGDLGIVKSMFGYHVIYLTEISDYPAFFAEAREDLYNDMIEIWKDEMKASHKISFTQNYDKAIKNIDIKLK